MHRSQLLLVSLAFAACAGSAPVPAAPSIDPLAAPAPGAWSTWSRARKQQYMERVVLPDAQKMFAKYDAVRYREVTCRTCHGAGADDRSYRMPNPALPTLVPTKILELATTSPEALIFMDGAVMPHMAKLLGQPTFDHVTMSGFGCFACHVPRT
jgi:hypothetical protein